MRVELIESEVTYPESPYPRSEGTHVSSVLRAIAQENGVLKRERAEEFGLTQLRDRRGDEWWASLSEDVRLKISMGLAWEQWYIPQLEDVLDHPGEMCVQGVYMTHDGESLDVVLTQGGELLMLCLHEVKLTYKSINTVGDLSTQWLWLAQCKAYCKGLNTLVAYLHVLFVCGDYTWPMRPKLMVYRVTYTQAEIDENWDIILEYLNYQRRLEFEESIRT